MEGVLGVPFHWVGVAELKVTNGRGFEKARRGEYGCKELSKECKDRLMRKLEGASLGKD